MLLIIEYIISNIFFVTKGGIYMFKKLCRFFRIDRSDLSYEEAISIYKRHNGIIIDVRNPEEYKSKHVKGAINIPLYEMDNIKNEIIDPDEVILLYCKTGKRSRMAKEILLQEGYENVYTFDAKI